MEHDPALPELAVLLGQQAHAAFAPALARAGGRLEAVRPTQVRYDPGRRLVVRYAAQVTWAGGRRRTETLGALVNPAGLPEGLAVVEQAGGARIGVWRYPHDPFLPGLAHAAYPDGARRVLDTLGLPTARVRVTPVVYRPGSRAVLRVETAATTVYLKVLRPGQAAVLRHAHMRVARHVRVPRCLGWSDALGLVALEALPGRTLARPLVDGSGALPAPEDVVALAARLAPAAVHRPPPAATAVVDGHVRLLAAVLPEAAGRAAAIAESVMTALASRLTAEAGERTVHGDFYEAQVLVDHAGGLVGLLDVEGVRRGAAHEDPATLVGHLAALAHVHTAAAPRITAYLGGVLHCLRGTLAPEVVRSAAAGVLLGIATMPFRRQEPDWTLRTLRWLDLAAAWAAPRREAAA